MPPLGLYVHVPFCARKCAYCDFASWPGRENDMPRYADAVCAEIARRAAECGHPAADTVFFGGGTPSLLPPALFRQLAQTLRTHFDIAPDAEWTVECNPGTLTQPFADTLAACGVNRVSLGMQAAQPALLKRLNRIHDMDGVRQAVSIARAAGIGRLNLDLMLGLPGQTMADWRDTLDAALSLAPQHISCYALIVEEGTPLAAQLARGEITLPGEDAERAMYGAARDILRAHGFHQYEISNFAKDGFACRHNLKYWNLEEYLGLGPAAHSFYHERRFSFKRDLKAYIRAMEHPQSGLVITGEDYLGFGCAAHSLWRNTRRANPAELAAYLRGDAPETEQISPDDAMFESLMLGLRLTQGMDEADFARRHGRALWDVYGARLAPALRDGRLMRQDGRLYLTEHGMDVMNSVLVDAMGE